MTSEGISENHVAIMDSQKFILSDQKQLRNKQKIYIPAAYGLLAPYILRKCLILKVLMNYKTIYPS